MKQLSSEAIERLLGEGIDPIDWAKHHFGDAHWGGDSCGCPDDRCIGHHHSGDERCQCLPALIDDYHAERS